MKLLVLYRKVATMPLLIIVLLASMASGHAAETVVLSGDLMKWHNVTLTFGGPEASETGDPNPFSDYRMDVRFSHATGGSVTVPGYFAADGNAAITSADAGNKWRVHFAPHLTGEWTWKVSFRQGAGVALDDNPKAGQAWEPLDGAEGSFTIAPSDKTGRDHRGKGRLEYVGQRYLRFAETGEYFLKCGADAPENFLAYDDFDATPNKGNWRKSWEPHADDFDEADKDLLWGPNRDKGRGILGAISYLASEGMNAFSFLTFNVDGDDGNVFPHRLKTDQGTYEAAPGKAEAGTGWDDCVYKTRFDVSKLAQWEQVFTHGDRQGMYLHFKMQETEVDQKMDGGDLGPERKAYCRELVARFSHHLALNWNIGEENSQTTDQVRAMVRYLREADPYDHNVVIHTFPKQYEQVQAPFLGDSGSLTGLSIQTHQPDFARVYPVVREWVIRSTASGHPWVVACDEPGDATHGMVPDSDDPQHNLGRKNALWGTIMAGGAGVEWYFGYQHAESDLTCQDWRSRDLLWDQCRIALNFFKAYDIPLERLRPVEQPEDAKVWVMMGKDRQDRYMALAYLPNGGTTDEGQLPEETFSYGWFNPRTGEGMEKLLHTGTVDGGLQTFTAPDDQDWLLLIVQGNSLPVSRQAGVKAIVLSATEDFSHAQIEGYAPAYVDTGHKALAIDAAKYKDQFAAAEAVFDGPGGTYDIRITTLTETDGESTYALAVNGSPIGSFTNPPNGQDYTPVQYVWNRVALERGDTIRVAFNSASNGTIPEGGGFAFSRGRFTRLRIGAPGTMASWFPAVEAAPEPVTEAVETAAFVFGFDPATAETVFEEADGVLAVEGEHFAEQTLTNIRKWYVASVGSNPGVMPDPDENHAEGASGGAYIELLPDTRATHDDPLIGYANFTNEPGRLAVLHYPVYINTPGRYYVWCRVNCTGTEDNGLHVGIDGEWPASGQRMQWVGMHGQWQWDSRQRTAEVHTGVRHQIWLDVEEPGYHTIMFSMREDGFELDKWLMTTEPEMEVPQGMGPEERLHVKR